MMMCPECGSTNTLPTTGAERWCSTCSAYFPTLTPEPIETPEDFLEHIDRVYNSSAVGMRHNTGKPRLSFNSLGREVLEGEAAVWESGAKKYAPGNWLKGMSWCEAVDSLQRHVVALLAGQDLDLNKEGKADEKHSGLPHVDHIVCCAKILSNSFHTRKDLDDRPK